MPNRKANKRWSAMTATVPPKKTQAQPRLVPSPTGSIRAVELTANSLADIQVQESRPSVLSNGSKRSHEGGKSLGAGHA